MADFSSTAQTRAQLFQLLALGFVHPVEEFYHLLDKGSYSLALARATHAALGMDIVMGHTQVEYTDFEAGYIELFQVGKGGQPIVHLNAGNYPELLDSGSRPEFLLEYSAWYRHFGLKTNEDDQANEFPDHLVCQLEFISWLAHLEYSATDKPELQAGYQRAQRDFCQRHLCPMLELLVTALQKEERRTSVQPFFGKLAVVSMEATSRMLDKLVASVGDASSQTNNPDQIASVELWG